MFSRSIPPSNRSKVKSSAARALRQKLLETYPGFEPYIEEIMPKKASLEAVKLYANPLKPSNEINTLYPVSSLPTIIPTSNHFISTKKPTN